MSIFDNSSRYYDLLYQDKNYELETQQVNSLIKLLVPNARELLELGCGTGRYSFEFVRCGYSVHGVDISKEMLQEAEQKKGLDRSISFSVGDMRTVRLGKKFDVVASLFHVMSYQTTNQDVFNALKTMKEHLGPGGIAFFDYWYGPAVLTLKPEVRIKEVENEECKIIRVAAPEMFPNENLVEVHYRTFVVNKKTSTLQELVESHRMRYFFEPELEWMISDLGFSTIDTKASLSNATPSNDSWSVLKILRLN